MKLRGKMRWDWIWKDLVGGLRVEHNQNILYACVKFSKEFTEIFNEIFFCRNEAHMLQWETVI